MIPRSGMSQRDSCSTWVALMSSTSASRRPRKLTTSPPGSARCRARPEHYPRGSKAQMDTDGHRWTQILRAETRSYIALLRRIHLLDDVAKMRVATAIATCCWLLVAPQAGAAPLKAGEIG